MMDLEVKEISSSQDTKERKQWFTAASFSHPAKMHLQLQMYLIEHYTKVGETILDPMGGSGTLLVGCALGRNVILVELEGKFCKMMEANWEKIRSLGPMLGCKMGEATILQGDARTLPELLVDKCVFSPPFADSEHNYKHGLKTLGKNFKGRKVWETKGQIDKILASPPYADISHSQGDSEMQRDIIEKKHTWAGQEYSDNPDNIGNLPYGKISAILTSPPYEGALTSTSQHGNTGIAADNPKLADTGRYAAENQSNIGNLKSENYLEAMLSVYQNCHRVLRDGGLLCLVVKNFIRDKKIVRLDLDTIKLCEKSGFVLKERLKRKLTSQSFWRIIYAQRFPDAPKIEYEDVLIFIKD